MTRCFNLRKELIKECISQDAETASSSKIREFPESPRSCIKVIERKSKAGSQSKDVNKDANENVNDKSVSRNVSRNPTLKQVWVAKKN